MEANRPVLLTIEDAARELSISRSGMYSLIRQGQIQTVKIGSSRRIPFAEIERLITAQSQDMARS